MLSFHLRSFLISDFCFPKPYFRFLTFRKNPIFFPRFLLSNVFFPTPCLFHSLFSEFLFRNILSFLVSDFYFPTDPWLFSILCFPFFSSIFFSVPSFRFLLPDPCLITDSSASFFIPEYVFLLFLLFDFCFPTPAYFQFLISDFFRAGKTQLGVTMSVIPWVACNPSQPEANSEETETPSDNSSRPLFLFLEGVDAKDPGGGQENKIPGVSRARREREDSSNSISKSSSSSSSRSIRRKFSSLSFSPTSAAPPPSSSAGNDKKGFSDLNPETLSTRPLEVIVYACLSFRNLLPVGIGWRVVGARGDPGARVAEGRLGPGEGVHVLEANTMSMAPSLSFQVKVWGAFFVLILVLVLILPVCGCAWCGC